MDGIRPQHGPPGALNPVSRGPGGSAMLPGGFAPGPFPGRHGAAGPDLAAVKTPAHYLAAARRRVWLILAVAVPMSILASIHALRQPKIYQAKTEIKVEAPHYDHALSTLVSHSASQGDARSQEKYAPNLVARLQSRGLAEMVVANARLAPDLAQMDDPAESLIVSKVGVRQVGKTEWYNVTLDGRDPALTKRLLEALVDELRNSANKESRDKVRGTVEYAQQNLDQLKRELAQQSKTMYEMLHATGSIGPGGRSILEEQYANLGQSLAQKQARLVELDQKLMIAQYFDRSALDNLQPQDRASDERLASLLAEKRMWVKQLEALRGKVRNFNSDPAAREFASRLDDVMHEIETLQAIREAPPEKTAMAADPNQLILERQQAEIDDDKAQLQELLGRIQQAMPQQQKFLELMQDRQQTSAKIAKMEQDIASFEILARSQNEPVYVPSNVVEPTTPTKPNRMILIAMGLAVSFGLGFALVFALEHLDHSVRVPEHVSHGLTLPLLGVVPRIVRTAKIYRGGHLLTTAAPDSLAADAFRNIRASLLGVADQVGPIVSLLVTSAKAGDGKSTAALNLASTCARAGERTLLLDVDLRRPSLGDVFPEDEDEGDDDEESGLGLGLVDILKGAIPWQRALRRTELHNLDFIATGDPTGVPIEILGTLELRQLLSALTHHYDRVILDGPAVLGMADCRVLGRMVDSSLLVVRAGAHQTVTLQRAKAVLQQSRVEIAGVVVNSLREGLKNWSSYGYAAPAAALPARESRAALTAAKG